MCSRRVNSLHHVCLHIDGDFRRVVFIYNMQCRGITEGQGVKIEGTAVEAPASPAVAEKV